ncbi:hypothetical protein PsYK624_095530 [Phanerochaete sordida]|uniref:Uncharacterized protein n=1 Tax=Phanerochaete sordida TaxID=48140 RepID=A0A9P3GGU8_9APHY|nr:hypothetical protein PsYK624_095530 [Phanerochaete sordida]
MLCSCMSYIRINVSRVPRGGTSSRSRCRDQIFYARPGRSFTHGRNTQSCSGRPARVHNLHPRRRFAVAAPQCCLLFRGFHLPLRCTCLPTL